MNMFKTADIRIETDSQGCRNATHKHQGVLIDWTYYESRQECRREAVMVLKARKESGDEPAVTDFYEDY